MLLSCLLVVLAGVAQVQSPEQFLGYKVGSRFTPHHRLVQYFQQVAQAMPGMVKLQQYGETNEGRPLYVAFISTAENISQLEEIRMNNMRLANMARDKRMPDENAPALVWLSYNVHGNEASSSEASMLTLFALVDPANQSTKNWLKNTVIIMDPCLNPDGRDRYVNWYNSVAGKNFNPLPMAREHDEPWPGGRSNHYNFDLNRDWAWQTQAESRQRMALYNQWLPQVHVDFHEQSINSPYYFAPAAEPYHEVITQWQRDFQREIGKNHAKYFDKNNWLYFTGEVFDLFYPSYGDTYPIYNGSIGMTYEQAGGGQAGLGIINYEKDTVTLTSRVAHHFTTGLSTIEVASANASKLNHEFRNFFNDGVQGNIGKYKTYVIKNNPGDKERLRSLMLLLDKNGIEYGTGSGKGSGYDYHSGAMENFTIESNDLVISSKQPKAAMVKVLFEPQSKLVDSVTYDITAWALPYAYGLQAYASTQSFAPQTGAVLPDFTMNNAPASFGYAIRWQGTSSAAAAAELLQKGIRVRYTETPFELNGVKFDRGTLLITGEGNSSAGNTLWKTVSDICNAHKVPMIPLATGMFDKGFDLGSYNVKSLKAARVAMLTGEGVSSLGAGEIWDFFDNELKYPITLINAGDANRIVWNDLDVLIMPDGNYSFLNNKETAARLHQWIQQGGQLITLENAVRQISKQPWSKIKEKTDSSQKKETNNDTYALVKSYKDRERESVSSGTPGAIYRVDVDNTHPLMFGYPEWYYTLKLDGRVYEFMDEGGWNTGILKQKNRVAGYVGYQLDPKLSDGLLFGVQDEGRGHIIYLADDVMFRNFWQNGKLMLCNAVFLVGR